VSTGERDPLAELERQLQRGGLYTHTLLSQLADRANEIESFLYGLVDQLAARGLVDPDRLAEAAVRVRAESETRGEALVPPVAMRVDPATPAAPPEIDCVARLPLCQAACCKLQFALSAEEVEAGTVAWDLGHPYFIRQGRDGYCVHNDCATRSCGVYQARPAPCRSYSCAGDARIWKDFEGRVINDEWLSSHLGPTSPRLVDAMMHRVPDPAPADE